MTNIRIALVTLTLGVAVGSGATLALRPSASAAATSSMPGMTERAKSPGDVEMDAAMNRMMHAMAASPSTGDQDRDFMLMMIPHHTSAVEMARVELRRGHRAELRELARDVVASQDREIARMRAWLRAWYGVRP